MNYTTRTVTGTWKTPNQQPAAGELVFTASHYTNRLDDPSIMVPKKIETYLDADGHIEVELPVTDQPSTDPIHWWWEVVETIKDQRRRAWTFYLPTGKRIDIVDIPLIKPNPAPLPVPPVIVEGPRGPRGYDGLDGADGHKWIINTRPPTTADNAPPDTSWLDTNTGTIYVPA